MSALLHPVGPESEQTYWVRRAIAVAALVVVLALVVWLVTWAIGRQSAGSPTPTTQAPTAAASPTMTGTSPSTPTMASSPAGSATPSASVKPPATSAKPSSVKPSSVKPTPTGPVNCDPRQVGLAIDGARRVVSGKSTTFELTFTNSDDTTCVHSFGANRLDLTITSGTDRVWTSAHCADWAPHGNLTLKAGKSWTWRPTWGTKRSAADCTLRDDYLRPGTYVLTASIDGGQSARWVFQLAG